MEHSTQMVLVLLHTRIPGDENCARMTLDRPATRRAAERYARDAWDLVATLDDLAHRFAWDYNLPVLLARSMLVTCCQEIYKREGFDFNQPLDVIREVF